MTVEIIWPENDITAKSSLAKFQINLLPYTYTSKCSMYFYAADVVRRENAFLRSEHREKFQPLFVGELFDFL